MTDRPKFPTPASGVRASTQDETIGKAHGHRDDEHTPVDMPASMMLHKINERAKLTSSAAIKTMNAATTTLDRIEDVRREMRDDVEHVESKVDDLATVVGEHSVTLAIVVTKLDSQTGQLDDIGQVLREDRELRQHHQRVRMTAEVDVDRAASVADIEVRKTGRLAVIEIWKGIALKIVAGIAIVAAAFVAGGRC